MTMMRHAKLMACVQLQLCKVSPNYYEMQNNYLLHNLRFVAEHYNTGFHFSIPEDLFMHSLSMLGHVSCIQYGTTAHLAHLNTPVNDFTSTWQ